MLEIFDQRNNVKKLLHLKDASNIYFREGDIWWCSIGQNIKSESNGKWTEFRRPILVLKKLSNDSCIAIPLSTRQKAGTWFYEYDFWWEKYTALLYQIKMIHKNRFQRKLWELDNKDFENIKKRLKDLLNL